MLLGHSAQIQREPLRLKIQHAVPRLVQQHQAPPTYSLQGSSLEGEILPGTDCYAQGSRSGLRIILIDASFFIE